MRKPGRAAINRPVTTEERELIDWLIRNAGTTAGADSLLDQVSHLRVVGGCGCGCPSVDFKHGGQDAIAEIIADADGTSPEGVRVGVILWSKDGRVSGLEVYPCDDTKLFGLPRPEDLKPSFGSGAG